MFKTYFKTALRSLWKKKSFSFLNVAGLAVGIACASLIFLWVEDEMTYSDHFKKKDQLYQVKEHQTYASKTFTFDATPGPLADAMTKEVPGIKTAVRATWGDRALFSKGDKNIYGDGMHVDSGFASLFSLEFIKGNAAKPFNQLHSVVLNERLALKIFNTVDVIGQTVKVDNDQEYIVDGVFKQLPFNTKFEKLDWFIPFEVYLKKNDWLLGWGSNGIQTFVELYPEANLQRINEQLKDFITKKDKEAIANPFLFSANDWRLRNNFVEGKQTGGRIRYVNLFSIIAWIILILACINFMNLATSRSEQRAREVGVRKVMGSGKKMLVTQFLIEALVMSFIAVVLAVGITAMALPAFNQLVEKEMQLRLLDGLHLLSLFVIGLLCGLIAGSYPAFYLSSFNPITVLKGMKLPSSTGVAFVRKGLVISQFVISVGLIICTLIIYQQVLHTKNRELGLNKNNVIYMSQQLISLKQDGNIGLHFATVKNELLATGVVENAALSNSRAFQIGSNSSGFDWRGKDPSKQLLIGMDWVTPEYVNTMGMQLIAGRDFFQTGTGDTSSIIVNESFAKVLSKKPADAVGQLVDRDNGKLMVVGVIKDFVYNNVYGAAAPMILFNDAKAQSTSNLTVRFKPGVDYKEALSKTEAVIRKSNPAYPFEYKFVDQEFENLFKGEPLIGTLAAVFAGLAIFISCLGLFGLAAYTAEKRTREIGIRKVLGASVSGLTSLLSIHFVKLVAISCVIAFPLSWWMMNNWLQEYDYRVTIRWWMFVIPAVLALIVAILTVSFQAIKAALANPVKSLRSE
ncbi:MAG: ABC transporter permease [Chitinophagaceae bacterium]|nr:ABC transporter permease [Chitinophagaceae bacterium]